MAHGFKVGDRVICRGGTRYEYRGVVESAGATMVTVRYDVAQGVCERGNFGPALWQFIAPAPPVNQRPIQPGDYIKDPGPMATIPQTAWAIGDLMVWAGADDRGLVYRVDRFDYGASRYWMVAGLGDKQRRYDAGLWALLPPDAVLDEARSPRRDGVTSVVAGPVVTPSPDVSFTPVTLETATGLDLDWLARDLTGATRDNGEADEAFRSRCLKYRASLVKRMTPEGDEHRALLSRALILISGLNLQHHAVTKQQFEVAQALCRDLVRVLKPGRG